MFVASLSLVHSLNLVLIEYDEKCLNQIDFVQMEISDFSLI